MAAAFALSLTQVSYIWDMVYIALPYNYGLNQHISKVYSVP